ncbi:PREDICTED: uncharacterized protein LOC109228137 [Nicotiana attenuata]|uniref:uncharacterized protein LOC109228137 n=1 Tax=Nicotiana attenuata TaxID=49451 RepID=UPI000904EF40|nr:PREDICTED: uncharacterized protein LOC109228137 [Nicotiana attenuata]
MLLSTVTTSHKLKRSIAHEQYDELEESIIFDKSDTNGLVFTHYDALVIWKNYWKTDPLGSQNTPMGHQRGHGEKEEWEMVNARRLHRFDKACPEDSFPLPHTDQLIDAMIGHVSLSFLDSYSGYNQILMEEKAREKPLSSPTRGRTATGSFSSG